MKKNHPMRLAAVAGLVLLLVLLALLARHLWLSYRAARPVAPQEQAVPVRREAVLYFAHPEGTGLIAEARDLPQCTELEVCLTQLVEALIAGPRGNLVPLFPPRTVVRSVQVAEGIATVDFSRELATDHPGGSMTELLTVYALADTLAVNYPHVRQVRIVLEGQPVETLKGHIDLRNPVAADFRYTQSPESLAPAANPQELN